MLIITDGINLMLNELRFYSINTLLYMFISTQFGLQLMIELLFHIVYKSFFLLL